MDRDGPSSSSCGDDAGWARPAWLGRDPDWEVHYALFARTFGPALQELAAAEGDVLTAH